MNTYPTMPDEGTIRRDVLGVCVRPTAPRERGLDGSDLPTGIGRCQAQARTLVIAAYAISEGCRVELASKPGRALSESEAAVAVLAGHPLVVVE